MYQKIQYDQLYHEAEVLAAIDHFIQEVCLGSYDLYHQNLMVDLQKLIPSFKPIYNVNLYYCYTVQIRQFSEIIEELCQKCWIDYIRKNSTNAPILNKLPNLEQFMFEPSRSQLNAVANVLVELQDCKCFYCNKPMRKGNYAVDHFIPWSMYPSDTGHNFVW